MKKYDIWSEGYLETGMEGIPQTAMLIAEGVEGEDFIDAVKKWYDSVPNREDYGKLTICNGKAFLYCRLFDNEADARKAFG